MNSANGSRASSGVSRLAMMQARFQAQQLMEREQKLIHILEDRQEEAIRRIAYNNRDSVHSANSLSSTNSNSGSSYNSTSRNPVVNANTFNRSAGVRSADLHSSPIGWDKSYPLRPMLSNDPGLPPSDAPPQIPRTPSMGLYKRNSTAGLSNLSGNKYSGGYGPKGSYVARNRGLSLDRLQGNGFSNGNSLQTSPARKPSYGLTRTRSQAHILHGHSSGEDSYGSSSRPPSTYDAYGRHEMNLNRSNSHLYNVGRNGNHYPVGLTNSTSAAAAVVSEFLDSPPSPPGSRKTSYTREYVRNLPTTVSGHSAPATRGRLTRRSQTTLRPNGDASSHYDHSSYSSQSSDKSEEKEKIIPLMTTSLGKLSSASVAVSDHGFTASSVETSTPPMRPRINSQTFRKSRSPGKRQSRSPSRSPGRSTFASDENDRVNNNNDNAGNGGNFLQKSVVREREEEKRRLQAEMRRREQELLAKIKEQQRELETMKQEKGKVERELHRQELIRERERTEHQLKTRQKTMMMEPAQSSSFKNSSSQQRPPPLSKRQVAVSRSSSSATSSSASKPDPEDEEDEDEVDTNPRCLRSLNRPSALPPATKSKTYINNDTPKLPRSNRISNQSPAVLRRNRASDQSPAPNRRAKSEALVNRNRAKDPSPAANVREPLTLSSLRAAAGNTSNSTPASRRKALVAAPAPPSNNATSKKKPAAAAAAAGNRSRLAPKPREDLNSCANCGRNFAEDRIAKHQEICIKTSKKKRKTFDMTKKRLEGTDAENFNVKKGGSRFRGALSNHKAQEAPKKKGDWRKKRQEFIAALRAAKEAQRHLAAGGKISDLPPPPPSDTSDYIQCPHCKRKFSEAAAERHIPKCKDIKSNKRR